MKLNSKVVLSLLVLILAAVGYFVSKNSAKNGSLSREMSGLSAAEVVEKFYTAVSGDKTAYDESSLYEAYFSKPLKEKIVEMKATSGYDPILCAEDRPLNIRLETVNEGGDAVNYIITETFSDGSDSKVAVRAKKISGRWFVDDINCFAPKPKISQ